MEVMARDEISPNENTDQLKKELAQYYKNEAFLKCKSMGEIVWTSLEQVLVH
jgi:hypothetical protein